MGRLSVAAVLAVGLLPTAPARAGLYNTEEHLLNIVLDKPAQYPSYLGALRQIVAKEMTNVERSPRHQVLQYVTALEQKLADGQLSMQDRVNLSAFYVRLDESAKAVALLESVPHRQREWMLLSNLSTAYFQIGNLDRAESYLMDALEKWPLAAAEANPWRLNWLKVVEQHQLRLIRGRLREQKMGGGPATSIDAIFPGLKLVGPSGEYEAGLLANDQWAKLPAHYMEIVQLLVLWMPHDARLRWLLAEMLNANSYFATASEMMEDLSETRGFRNAEFAAHQLTLRHAKTIGERLFKLRQTFVDEKVKTELPMLAGLLPPGPSVALDAVGTAMALEKIVQAPLPKEEASYNDLTSSPASTPSPSATWSPEWRQISVSFVAGVIVALLLSMQLREMRKRKQDAQPAARE